MKVNFAGYQVELPDDASPTLVAQLRRSLSTAADDLVQHKKIVESYGGTIKEYESDPSRHVRQTATPDLLIDWPEDVHPAVVQKLHRDLQGLTDPVSIKAVVEAHGARIKGYQSGDPDATAYRRTVDYSGRIPVRHNLDDRPRARTITVIEVVFTRGDGVESDPVREVTAYFDLDGTKLAENDPYGAKP